MRAKFENFLNLKGSDYLRDMGGLADLGIYLSCDFVTLPIKITSGFVTHPLSKVPSHNYFFFSFIKYILFSFAISIYTCVNTHHNIPLIIQFGTNH